MRGLKLDNKGFRLAGYLVALFTSAWIETLISEKALPAATVALFTSAWIETKLIFLGNADIFVALFTSAWIETDGYGDIQITARSHSSRVRGLKLVDTLLSAPTH